jgi:hypothetical protein
MAREIIGFREKIFLYVEAFFILIFLLLTLVELYAVFMMYSTYISSQSLYYFYLVHNRLQMKNFNAYIIARSPNDECPYHPPASDKSPIRISYVPRQILALGTIKASSPVDVTSNTQVYDNFPTPLIQNNTMAKKKYFEFDVQEIGTSTLNLLTNYVFNIWKGVNICAVQFYYNDPRAYQLIPKPANFPEAVANTWCKEFTQDSTAQACGVYFDTYQTCSLITYTSVNNSLRGDAFDSSYWSDQGWTCPFNYFDMNFTYNPFYNSSDPQSMKIDGSEYMQFLNTADVAPFPNLAPRLPFYQSIVDKYLLYDLDNAFLGNFQTIEYPNDTLSFATEDSTIYTVGQPYGFKDPFNGIWDTYSFMDFFNDTYFDKPVYNPKSGKTTYNPKFLVGPDDNTFYRPVDNHKYKLNVSLTYWGQPTVTKECFEQFIHPQKKYDWLVQLNNLQTLFLDDSLPLLLAWLFVKLFISGFWQISIRAKLIYEKLSRGYNFPADIKSDYPTRFTTKVVGLIMFALLFNGLLYQDGYFSRIISFSKNMIIYNCYSDKLIQDSLTEYRQYVERLLDFNNLFLFSMCFSLSLEIITTVGYVIDYYIQKKMEQEELLIAQATLKKSQ